MTTTDDEAILVVEDDRDTLDSLCAVLAQLGYQAIGALNGKIALDRLQAMRSSPPCLIILDIMMPVMDGWQLRKELQRDPDLAGIPIIVVSADLSAGQSAAAAGVDFIAKPIEVENLVEVVRRVC